MAYVAPTAAEFKVRFPEFSETADDTVQAVLDECASQVDDSWIDGDRRLALMLLTAHTLTTGESAASGGGLVTSQSIGPISISYKVSDSVGRLQDTAYGARFYDMQRANFPAVLVI